MNVASPCTGICQLDGHDICVGCLRSGDEIARWTQLDDREKNLINIMLPARRSEAYDWGAQPPRLPFDAPPRRTVRARQELTNPSVSASEPPTGASSAAPGGGRAPVAIIPREL